jgi:hypothetical protein
MVRTLAHWWHLLALHEGIDALDCAMCILLNCPGSMVIEIVINLATFFYIDTK